MKSEFIVSTGCQTTFGTANDGRSISEQGFYKSLSLFHAIQAGLNVPPTFLLLEPNVSSVQDLISRWSLPLMVRMDYRTLPALKPLGGIPLHSQSAISSIVDHLFQERLCPLFHPHIDRFRDVYSVGILLTKNSPEIQIEIVGSGFDASDLRLGKAIPHESFTYDTTNDSLTTRRQIAVDDYAKEKAERAKRIAQLRCYIDFANQHGCLLPSLDGFKPSEDEIAKASETIPNFYTRIGRRDIKTLAGFAWKLQVQVLPSLPDSELFVASMSLVPEYNWILWDVYGHWYQRC